MEWGYLLREIFAEKTRVFLTVFAIAWGTLSICLMLSVGEGVLQTLTNLMDRMGSNLIVVSGLTTAKPFEGLAPGQTVQLKAADRSVLKKVPGAGVVTPEYNTTYQISYGAKKRESQSISGIEPAYQNLRDIQLKSGRFINQLDLQSSKLVVVLGFDVAKGLFGSQRQALGQLIHVGPFVLRVIGVTKWKNQLGGYETDDNNLIWIPATTFKALFSPQGIRYWLVSLLNKNLATAVEKGVRQNLAEAHHFAPSDKGALWVFNNAEYVSKLSVFFRGVQVFLGLVGALTLLIASLGIANVMYVAVESAIGEIGIRMAVGAQKSDIVRHYVVESLLVTAVGGFVGFAVCYGLILAANPFVEKIKFLDSFSGLHLSLSFGLALAVIIILGFVGFLAGIFPARRASKIQIVEALYHE